MILLPVAGTTYRYILRGTDTQGTMFSATVTITIPQVHELTYLNVLDNNTASNFTTTGASSGLYQNNQITLRTPIYTGDRYVMYAQPATEPDITAVQSYGFNVFGTFTKNANAVTIGGVQYDVWVTARSLLAQAYSGQPWIFMR